MLTDDMKARVAAATTNAHVEATGAPRVFVHVSSANCLQVPTTAPARSTTISGITGAIRAGRPLAVKQKLIKQICASWCEITGQSGKQLVAGLTEIDSDAIRPDPPAPRGETEWFATNADALDGIQGTGL